MNTKPPRPADAAPFARPLYAALKPAGPACNLNCTYCYYLAAADLYPRSQDFRLDDSTLEEFIVQYIAAQTMAPVTFSWHGGEPLLRDVEFYRRALSLQRKYAQGRPIDNTLQTNGTLLTDRWCGFFKENDFLIGISVDGSERLHDRHRRTKDGRPTFAKVMRGVELLVKHGVEFNIMATVNDHNVDYPLELYDFFRASGSRFLQFAPVVETSPDGQPTPWSVPAGKWGDFLIAIFDRWFEGDIGQYFVQYFDAALANWMGIAPGVCIFARECGHAGVMEHNGDVYCCDHFVRPEYKLGNIRDQTLAQMLYSPRQARFGADKHEGLCLECRECSYLFACRGECPKNRISLTPRGEKINYLCSGYRKFFRHIEPRMERMREELQGRI